MRTLLFAAVLSAPLAAAQTAPADPWPLVPGNTWTYVLYSGVSAGSGGTYSNIDGGSRWTATDSVDTPIGRLPGLSVDGTDCVVRSSDGVLFELLDETVQNPCDVPGSFARLIDGRPGFFVSPSDIRDVVIGGETVANRQTRSGFDSEGFPLQSMRFWITADGIGVLGYSDYFGRPSFASTSNATLRQLTTAGVTVGQSVETRTDFWPLAADNRWEFLVTDALGASAGAVAWTVETVGTGLALRVEHVQNSALVSTATCPLSLTEPSAATGWRTYFALNECALPEPLLAPSVRGTAQPLRIDLFTVGRVVAIGSETLNADVAEGSSDAGRDGSPITSYSLARGVGPVRYSVYVGPNSSTGQPSNAWVATLAYARVGSTTHGAHVVAGEDAPAATAALALSVGPNPVRASATLAFLLPAATEARIEILDALGRTVQRLDLGTRSAGAHSACLSVSGLAAGVYSVRLVAGDVQTATRISIVR